MEVAVLGGGGFVLPLLDALHASHHDLVGVVARPDMKAGRGRRHIASPAAAWAAAHDVHVLKPPRVSDPEFEAQFKSLGAKVAFVADFGEILRPLVFSWTTYGFFGVHPSLLPRWRGAAPVPWAILSGDRKTGVVVFKVGAGVDTGAMAGRVEAEIRDRETAEQLEQRLARLGAELALDIVGSLECGTLRLSPQGTEAASKARRLRKEDGRLDWAEEALALDRRVRGLLPWPCAWFTVRGTQIKVLEAWPVDDHEGRSGRFLGLQRGGDGPEGLVVGCGKGCLLLVKLQSPGKRPLCARDWLNGFRLEDGELLE